ATIRRMPWAVSTSFGEVAIIACLRSWGLSRPGWRRRSGVPGRADIRCSVISRCSAPPLPGPPPSRGCGAMMEGSTMRRNVPAAIVVLGLVLAWACSTAQPQGRPTRDRNVLTAAELEQVPVETAYDATQRLRPEFLRARGQLSLENRAASL